VIHLLTILAPVLAVAASLIALKITIMTYRATERSAEEIKSRLADERREPVVEEVSAPEQVTPEVLPELKEVDA
jgi:hypothetical protein